MTFPRDNLAGRQFGKLTVSHFTGRYRGAALWYVVCECGKAKIVRSDHLKSGLTTSCGCGIREGLRKANTKHGRTGTVEYRLWTGMLTRCYNTKEKAYKYYGGRGIVVCKRWQGDGGFQNFLADMGERPSKNHQIERENNDRNYTPNNCRWATRREQSNNRSTTIRVKLRGKSMALKEACQEIGLNYYSVRSRMQRERMSFQEAITAPWRAGRQKRETPLKLHSINF